jgi:hypothetical protein
MAASLVGCGNAVAVDQGVDNAPGSSCRVTFGDPAPIAATSGVVLSIVVEKAHVTWMTETSIERVPRAGGAVETIATGSDLRSLVLAASGDLLWSSGNGDGSFAIWRAGASGEPPLPVISGLSFAAGGIAQAEGAIYWVDHKPQMSICCGQTVSLYSAPLAGGEPIPLGSADDGGSTRTLGVHSSGFYFTNGYAADPYGHYRLERVIGDGTEAKSLASSRRSVRAVFVGEAVFYTEVDYDDSSERASILRRALPDGEIEIELDASEPESGRIWALGADATRVAWSGEDRFVRARCAGKERGPITSLEAGDVWQIAIDGDDLYIAVKGASDYAIKRVPLH